MVRAEGAAADGDLGRLPPHGTEADAAEASWEHLVRDHCFSIDKARTLLGYAPRYEPEEAILESVRWLVDHGRLDVAHPLQV